MLRSISRGLRVMRTKWRRLGRNDSGSVLTFLVVIPVLVGTVAIGVETGQLYRVKRQMQSAADAAALAASVDNLAGKSTTVIAADALYEAQRNSFANGVGGVTVTVNSPPLSGPNVATPGAVEVIITKNMSFSLGAVINNWMGVTNNGFTMQARSVAAQGTYTSTTSSAVGCIVGLTTNNEQGILFDNFEDFASNCALVTNATATVPAHPTQNAIYMGGFHSATLLTAWSRGTFTADTYTGTLTLTNPAQNSQATAVTDPYAGLATPFVGSCSFNNFNDPGGGSGQTKSLSPGTYCGGLSVTHYNKINFAPGTYYIADGLLNLLSDSITCSACTGGAGVTFVLTTATGTSSTIAGATISTNNITLTAPSSGTYAGILFYQDRRATLVTGGANSSPALGKMFYLGRSYTTAMTVDLSGAIYFPRQMIQFAAVQNTSSANCTVFIGWYVHFTMNEYHTNDSDYITGCRALATTPVSITTTTTASKSKSAE